MNYFYVQIEEGDNPTFKTVPVVVDGKADETVSIVTIFNYDARSYGIHAGMPSSDSKDIIMELWKRCDKKREKDKYGKDC